MRDVGFELEQHEELDEVSKALEDLKGIEEAANEDGQDFIDKYLNNEID